MGHEGHEVWLKDALVFLLAAGVIVPFLRVFRLSPVLGFLLAGVVLGPFGLGALTGQVHALTYITISEPEAAAPLAELGVLFLLFLLGLELSPARLWSLKLPVFGGGGLQASVSAISIGAVLFFAGLKAPAAIVGGLALALSSTAIVMQLLIEERRAASATGRTALAVLLFQDLLVAPILILISFIAPDGDASPFQLIADALVRGAAALVAIILIGRYVLRHVFRFAAQAGGRDFLMALTLLTVVGAAIMTALAGLSVALGAFLAGVLLGETEFKHQAQIDLEPFKGLLLGLFFMTVGMGLNLADIAVYLPPILAGLVGLVALKTLIAWAACRMVSGDGRTSLETAFLLAPAGEFAFVILAAGAGSAIFSAQEQTIIAAVAGLSMLITPFYGRLGAHLATRLGPSEAVVPFAPQGGELDGHVIIAGFGRVGRAVARILESEKADVVALDQHPALVSRERKNGWRVYYGDAGRPEFLWQAGSENAKLFVVTVDDAESAEAIVRGICAARPDATILARAMDVEHAARLRDAGASYVIPDAIEAGLQMAGRALEEFGYGGDAVRDRLAAERSDAYSRATEE